MLSCLPALSRATEFALKGGTAINMFIRSQYPRLSVDLDLTYLPVLGRDESLLAIEQGLLNIGNSLEKELSYEIEKIRNSATKTIAKLIVHNANTEVTIEPNLILRGSVYPIVNKTLSKKVENLYQIITPEIQLLSVEEIYAGKICAALDRQHPRDLFDIKFILEEGISQKTKIAFLIYLMSNNRPMFELLAPNRLDQSEAYNKEFVGMTNFNISYEELENIREQLITTIKSILNEQDKQFLISVKKGSPNWQHINIPHVANLPSIRWKMINLAKMDLQKSREYLAKLEAALYD